LSLAGPKARPTGVADGSLVDIPEPGRVVEYVGTRSKSQSREWLSVFGAEPGPLSREAGRVRANEWNPRGKRSWDGGRREKPRRRPALTVPQTDTGRQVEDTKAFERTLVKELGNLTP